MTDRITKKHLAQTRRTSVGLYFSCGLLTVAILLFDFSIPLGVVAGIPYIAVVLLSLKSPSNRFTVFVAIICSILTVVKFVVAPPEGEMWKVIFNRGLTLFAIWVTALLTLAQRVNERKLIEERLNTLVIAKNLEVQEERLKVLKATMRTVQDIVGNFLNNLLLFQMEAEEKNALQPESLERMNSLIHDTSARLKKLGDLDTIYEKQMAGGAGIDYERYTEDVSTQQDPPADADKPRR